MKTEHDKTMHGDGTCSGAVASRRSFMKACGAATAAGVARILLPVTAEAQDSFAPLGGAALQGVGDELFWGRVRRQFALKPGIIYMNTGTEGAMPRVVLSRLQRYFREFAGNPWDALTASDILGPIMKDTRTNIAEFLGAQVEEILLTHNTTEGMCFTANGLNLQEGDEVLTTLHEHSAGFVCWEILKERRKVTVTQIELPTPATGNDEIVAAFRNAITPRTKVMSFCHINFTTGLRMPVKELCQLARENGIISVVDGAHAIGMIGLNLNDLGCDFYATSPHKWLNAPPGTGVLYIREGMLEHLWPTVTETAPFATSILVLQGRGQQCTPAFACLNDLIDFHHDIGRERIESRILDLSSYLKGRIKDLWGEESLFSPEEETLASGLVSFNPFEDHYDVEKIRIYRALREEYRIIIRPVNFKDRLTDSQATQALRVSTNIFNNYHEIDTLVSALETLISRMEV